MTRRQIMLLALAVSFIPILGFVLSRHETSVVSYLTAPIERGDLRTTLSATGSLNAVVTVEVGSQLSGQVAELLVDFNDEVTKGQAIARLDPRTFEAAKLEAEAALAVARAKVEMAKAGLEGAKAEVAVANGRFATAGAEAEKAQFLATDARRDFERKKQLQKTLARAAVEHAAATYHSAAAEVRAARAGQTVSQHRALVSEADLKTAEADFRQAMAAVDQQAAALEQARIDLARTVIRAPIDGVVISRNVDTGQTVAASLEAPTLFTIAQDLRQMEVLTAVDEADIGKIRPGQNATFVVDAYPGRTFSGTVTEIRKAPQVIQNVVAYTVVLSADNADLALLPGMTAIVRVVVESVENVLRIPNAALRFWPPDDAVSGLGLEPAEAAMQRAQNGNGKLWVLGDDGTPSLVEVNIGRSDGKATEIIDGTLSAGQEVIVGTATNARKASLLDRIWGL